MNSVYQSEAPYAWSSPLVAAATGVFAPDFLSRQLALQGEGEFAPYADWHFTNNEGQKAFFSPRHYPQALALAQRLLAEDKPELIGMASNDVAILNWLFAQNGFPNMKLDPVGPDGMAIATILRLLRHFPEVVQKGYSLNETMPHEAFRFPRGTFQVYNLDQNLLIEIGFPNGDRFYLSNGWTSLEGPALSNFVVTQMSKRSMVLPSQGFNGLVLPSVSFEIPVDVSFFLGLEVRDLAGVARWVTQAIKQVKFNMGPRGIIFEAAFGMAAEMCLSETKLPEPGDIVFDEKFVGWFISGTNVICDKFPTWVIKVPVAAFSIEDIEIPSKLPTYEVPVIDEK